MKEDDDDQPTCSAGEGGTAPAGKDFNPSDLDQDAGAKSETPEPTREVPIGRPVSEADYSRLKRRARDEDLPAGKRHAQEDPAHHERDG